MIIKMVVRYPQGFEFEEAMTRFKGEIQELGFSIALGKIKHLTMWIK